MLWGIDESVAVQATEPNKLSRFKSWNHGENSLLLLIGHLCLETDQIIQALFPILLPQLNDGIRTLASAWVPQSTALIGPNANVSLPRSAISSMGMQPSNGTNRSKLCVGTRSAVNNALTKRWYTSLVSG